MAIFGWVSDVSELIVEFLGANCWGRLDQFALPKSSFKQTPRLDFF
jgi:hypothetical protein